MEREELLEKLQKAREVLQEPANLYRQKEELFQKARSMYNTTIPVPFKRYVLFSLGALGSFMYFWTDSRTIGYLLLSVLCIIAFLWTKSSYKSNKKALEDIGKQYEREAGDIVIKYLTAMRKPQVHQSLEFLPKEFWFFDAVDFFEKAIASNRADSLKEAIHQFDSYIEKQENAYMQAEISDLLKLQNQKLDDIDLELQYANFYGNHI